MKRNYLCKKNKSSIMILREELVHIGKIIKPHGLNGELEIEIDSEFFDECDPPYIVIETDGIFIPYFIKEYRYKNDISYLFSLKGIEDDVEAKEMIKREVYIHEKYLGEGISASELEGNEYFIGFSVLNEREELIGKIVDIDDTTENILFLLHNKEEEEIIIPASDDFIIEINETKKEIIMNLPEGLLSL